MKRLRVALVVGLSLLVVAVAIVLLRRGREWEPQAVTGTPLDAQVRAQCSRCHAFPPPEILPRSFWRGQIEHMAKLEAYMRAGPTSPPTLSLDDVVAWYEKHAPEALPERVLQTRRGLPPLRFRRRNVLLGADSGPGVATVSTVPADLAPDLAPQVASANMARGSIHLFSLLRGPRRIGSAGHPARVAPADLDGDGRPDLLISDLGDPMPSEKPVGRVLLARNLGGGTFEFRTLLEGVGRVADAEPIDIDGDGDLDVVVASFGFQNRGGIYVLYNDGGLELRAKQVIQRAGAVSVVPVTDLWPGAGPGFVAAFAQQYEMVSAFTQDHGSFVEHVLYRAPHPNWGTSNLVGVDLDQDGDLDFLLSHGDTLDDGIAFKPYHGVQWLENLGDGSFRAHLIGNLYGAQGAQAVDLDGDGDLDVVACSFLPQVQLPVPKGTLRVDSLVWFERDGDDWIPWSIEANNPRHTGLTITDLDGDGRPDIVAGINTAWDIKVHETGPSLEIWLNEGPRKP